MTTLSFSTDYVQLPVDGAGKRSSYYRFDTGGGDYLYLGAGVIVGATGVIADVDADGLKVNLGDDNDVTITGTVTVDGSGVTQPVSHAALTELAGAIDTEMQVDVVAALPAGNNNIGDVDIASLPNEGQQTMANSISVAIASNQSAVPVDGSGATQPVSHAALTELAGAIDTEMQVDVVAALPAGNNNIGDVDVASVAAGASIEVVGDVAADVGVPTNPVVIGARASTAQPTDVSGDGDSVHLWATRKGSLMVAPVPHAGLDGAPFNLTSKTVQVTTAQTGTDIWTPTSGKKLCITSYQIQAFSTTAGTCIIWFGANADTSYTRGTDLAIFDGEFKPSSTLAPGVVQSGIWIASAVDHEVHLTSVGDIDLTITLWGYEI